MYAMPNLYGFSILLPPLFAPNAREDILRSQLCLKAGKLTPLNKIVKNTQCVDAEGFIHLDWDFSR